MKNILIPAFAAALVLTGGFAATTCAQEDAEKPIATKTPKKNEVSEVAKAFKKAHPVQQGKINTNAKCYIYLQSASWCPPCRAEMPKIVEAYKEMKDNGVEIILCGCDHDKKGVKGYIKEFKIPFPAVLADKKLRLPGFKLSNSVPHATYVDKDGKVLKDGHGSITLDWASIISSLGTDTEE